MAETLTIEKSPSDSRQASESPESSTLTLTLAVDNMYCGACIRSVEQALANLKDVQNARANFTQRRVVVRAKSTIEPEDLINALKNTGYEASLLADFSDTSQKKLTADLAQRLGIAAFASFNIMLLSVSVWSGEHAEMDEATRTLFHWLSAIIALPAITYAGMPFFSSAKTAILNWHVNMDVPISLGVILATALSFYQTFQGRDGVYFDAAIMLLTFLLLGRLLDQMMRQKALSSAENLLKLRQTSVRIVNEKGESQRIPVGTVVPGMHVLVAAGERLAVDGRVLKGESNIDRSIITGETLPHAVAKGDPVFSGAINLLSPLVIEVTAKEEQSLLCEIADLMATAEQQRGRYVQIADRAAKSYAPMVHTLAAITFLGWMIAGVGWQVALPIAISVLIITCPCALALAVPAVQVAAAGRLLKHGIILKSADALERLAPVDTFVFDKTGTLTQGTVSLLNGRDIDDSILAQAASLAIGSTHPYSQAIIKAANERGLSISPMPNIKETAGFGLVAGQGQKEIRLGSASWCGISELQDSKEGSDVFFKVAGSDAVLFHFQDSIKEDADRVIRALRSSGYEVELLSGDNKAIVNALAQQSGIETWRANVTPAQKVEHLQKLKASGHNVAMVGDGLNDAPSLKAANVSLSPASATHISQAAADYVFQGSKLFPVFFAVETAKKAHSLVMQNFTLAIGYNIFLVPLAMAGLVTPLIAAIAMSLSSISVTANALRLHTLKSEL